MHTVVAQSKMMRQPMTSRHSMANVVVAKPETIACCSSSPAHSTATCFSITAVNIIASSSAITTPGVLQCERVPFPARPHFCVTCLPLHTLVRCRPCVLRATCLKTVQQHHTTSHQFSAHFSASRVITQSTAVQMGTNSSRHDILTNILNFSYHPFHHANPSHNLQRCQWAPTPAAVLPQPNTPD